VVAVAELLAAFGSAVALDTLAVLVIVVGAVVFRTQMSRRQNSTVVVDNSNQRTDSNPAAATVASELKPEVPPTSPAASDVLIKSKPTTVAVKNTSKPNASVTGGQQVDDFAIRSAAPVRIVDRAGEVSLTAPTKPLIVTMYDEHGGTRKIQLPPISFGSQRLTGNRTQVSMNNSKDW